MTNVGTGKYTYRLIQDWGRLPEGETFGMVESVATDSQDRVYIGHNGNPPVMVFDREGNYLSSWGNGAIASGHGFFIGDDIVYLADRADSVVVKFTLDGRPIQVIGNRGGHSDTGCVNGGDFVQQAAGPFNYPSELVPSPWGDLYVSDGYRNSRVHRFTGDGRLIASWGEPGNGGPNQFHVPHSIIAGQDGRVYVCDRDNYRIQIFSAEGEYLEMWEDLRRPTDIAMDGDGVFYITELGHGDTKSSSPYPVWLPPDKHERLMPRVSVMDAQGRVLSRWECRPSAHSVWVDSRGDIYVGLGYNRAVDKYVRV